MFIVETTDAKGNVEIVVGEHTYDEACRLADMLKRAFGLRQAVVRPVAVAA